MIKVRNALAVAAVSSGLAFSSLLGCMAPAQAAPAPAGVAVVQHATGGVQVTDRQVQKLQASFEAGFKVLFTEILTQDASGVWSVNPASAQAHGLVDRLPQLQQLAAVMNQSGPQAEQGSQGVASFGLNWKAYVSCVFEGLLPIPIPAGDIAKVGSLLWHHQWSQAATAAAQSVAHELLTRGNKAMAAEVFKLVGKANFIANLAINGATCVTEAF